MNLPPVPAWPSEVLPDEPVHGFFQRLAAANGQLSCRTFAASLGLNGRNYDFEQLLDFCSALPVAGREGLADSTPRRSLDAVFLKREKFSPSHFSFGRVRVCAACIAESRHHRNWFDFSFLERCPVHDQPLIDGSEQEKLARWFPDVGVLPYSGTDLAEPAKRVELPNNLARYVLGRVGCLPPWPLLHLVEYSCGEIIQVSELIGRMREFGWSPTLDAGRRWDAARRSRTEYGFSILRDGFDAVLAELGSFTAGAPVKPTPGQISFASGVFFGWLHHAAKELGRHPSGQRFRTLMSEHAARSGVFAKKGYERRFAYFGAETLTSLSRRLGIAPQKVRELGIKDGLFQAQEDKSLHHSLTSDVCDAVRRRLDDLIIREDAVNYAASRSHVPLEQMERDGLIRPFIRMGGPNRRHDHFSRIELEGCFKSSACPF